VEKLGFAEEGDMRPGRGLRLVRLTLGARGSLVLAARARR
jgi:hypothetical protein